MTKNESTPERWAESAQNARPRDTSHLIPVVPGKQGVDETFRQLGLGAAKGLDAALGTPKRLARIAKLAAQSATVDNLKAVGVAIASNADDLKRYAMQGRRRVMLWPDDIASEMKRAKHDLLEFVKELRTSKPASDEPESELDIAYEAKLAWLAVKQAFQSEPEYRRIQVKPYIPQSESRVSADETIARLFSGCRLEWTSLGKLKTATDVASAGKASYDAGKDAYKAGGKLAGAIKKIIKEAKSNDSSVFEHLGELLSVDPSIARDFATDIGLNSPVLRPIVAGVKAALHTTLGGLTIKSHYDAGVIADAHPSEEWLQLSLRSVRDLLSQKITRHAALLGTYTYDAITGMVDPTSASAVVSVGVRTGLMLHAKYQLFKQRKETNARLAAGGKLSTKMLEDCPLLGCYLLYMLDPEVIKGYFHDYDPAKIGEAEVERVKAEQRAKYSEKEVEHDDAELASLMQLAWKRLRASPLTLIDAHGKEIVPFSKANKIIGLYF